MNNVESISSFEGQANFLVKNISKWTN